MQCYDVANTSPATLEAFPSVARTALTVNQCWFSRLELTYCNHVSRVWADKWVAGGDTSATRVRTDYFHRNQAQVQFEIDFDLSKNEYFRTHNMPFVSLFETICALTAVIAGAGVALTLLHKATGHHKTIVAEAAKPGPDSAPDSADIESIDLGIKGNDNQAMLQRINDQQKQIDVLLDQVRM